MTRPPIGQLVIGATLAALLAVTSTTVAVRLDQADPVAASADPVGQVAGPDARSAPAPAPTTTPKRVHAVEAKAKPKPEARAVHKPEPRLTPASQKPTQPPPAKPGGHGSLKAARGLSAWVDLYDYGEHGSAAAAALADVAADHNVGTIWVETSRYNTKDIRYPRALGALVDRAHARGLRLIAWVLPEFQHPKADKRKARAAAKFRSPGGHGFNALGLDIEVSTGARHTTRTSRLVDLAETLHHHVGMPVIGIVPPPIGFQRHPTYWPGFPWKRLAHRVDAIATMGYWTYTGAAPPGKYTEDAIRQTRKLVHHPAYPVHVIGGLAEGTSVRGAASFCESAKLNGALGASLYDLTSTPDKLWKPLQACRRVGR